jgi:RNAse (barnase) inhibitor barstar
VEAEVSGDDRPRLIIDGAAFDTLEGFFQHFSEIALDGGSWGRNLDAFNDVLRGGFGTPEGGFILEWRNHALSRLRLGHVETARQYERMLQTCHPNNVARIESSRRDAVRREGATVFDWIIGIIVDHGPGGNESEDGIELVLS